MPELPLQGMLAELLQAMHNMACVVCRKLGQYPAAGRKSRKNLRMGIVMRIMAKIAIINLKGGVGKSVTACNLACLLAETWSRRVLVMDLDKQGNTTKFFNRFAYGRKTMGDVLTLNAKMQDVIMQTDFEHVDLAPSNMEMLLANKNVMLDVLRPQWNRLRNALDTIRNDYDYCIIDCPPDIDMATVNALAAADWVIIPVDCDEWAMDGMDEIHEQVDAIRDAYNPQLEVMGVLATKYTRGRYSVDTINEIANMDLPAFRNPDNSILRIDYSVKVKEAKARHLPVHKVCRNIKTSAQYKALAQLVKKCVEVSHLAGMMAAELGADVYAAKRAGLLHDIGKAVDHEMEGTHVALGVEFLRKYHEKDDIIHAVQAHHNDVEPQTIVACLVQAADAISAARPGARRENLENYIKRLEQLEEITGSYPGVDKAYAIQAGREVRVMVKPDQVSEDQMVILARELAKKIEEEMEYPGQIKVHVLRETTAVEYAK